MNEQAAKLNDRQREVVLSESPHVITLAAAASGKTATLVTRLRYLLSQGADPSKIVVITFTNMAAEEIYDRVGHLQGLFIGTIHSYANQLLLAAGIPTRETLDEEDFDTLFELVRDNPQCIKPVEHLLLDEAQDTNELEFEFILDMVHPTNYMFFGDARQCIFQFKGSRPDILVGLAQDPDVKTYHLVQNYRNGSSILNFARRIIARNGPDYIDDSIPMRDTTGRVLEQDYSNRRIIELIQNDHHYGDWFVLSRTNAQLDYIYDALQTASIPCDTFKKAQLNTTELNQKMNENTVKVLTIHTAKGLEAPKVIVTDARFWNEEERCVSYVAATRARDTLIWMQAPRRRRF